MAQKIIIATNNLPATTDKTIGFYRRWLIIDFPNQFNEKIDILSTIPKEEYESLALKCCSILHDLLIKREFTNEGDVGLRMSRYEEKSNPLMKFIEEYCDTSNPNSYIFSFDFKKRFDEWCKEKGFRYHSDTSIGRKLSELGISKGKQYADFGEHKQIRCWFGIEWKNEIEPNKPPKNKDIEEKQAEILK